MDVELPFPSSVLSSNSRAHWSRKSPATRKHREWARIATLACTMIDVPAEGRIRVVVTFYPPSRRWDHANLPHMAKAYLDGIADALRVNDNRFDPVFQFAEPEKPGKVVFIIGPEESECTK